MLTGNMKAGSETPTDQSSPPQVVMFGLDRVELHDQRVVIESPVDMDRWDVVEHRKPLIRFDGRTWTLSSKSLIRDGCVRYELVSWDPEVFELPGYELEYGAGYVEARDESRCHNEQIEIEATVLNLLSPLAGFLFARTKRRLEDRTGITAVSMTSRSLFLQYLLILCAFIYTTVGVFSTGFSGIFSGVSSRTLDGILLIAIGALVLLLDAIVRWGRLADDEREPPGFYEWLWRPQQRPW